jgi:hypothetical protein
LARRSTIWTLRVHLHTQARLLAQPHRRLLLQVRSFGLAPHPGHMRCMITANRHQQRWMQYPRRRPHSIFHHWIRRRGGMRVMLYEAAQIMLVRLAKWSWLKAILNGSYAAATSLVQWNSVPSFPAGADGERDLAPNRPPCHLPPCHPVPLRHHLHRKPAGSLSTSATVREPTSVSPRPDIVERVFSVDALKDMRTQPDISRSLLATSRSRLPSRPAISRLEIAAQRCPLSARE